MTNPVKYAKTWINVAHDISTESKDRSTKVGCVIISPKNTILTTGWNGFPRGVDDNDPAKHERPDKYKWTEHAERNAIYNHARVGGGPLEGSTAFLNWEPYPCEECMRALAQSGICTIVGPNRPFGGVGNGTHYDTDTITRRMIEETGVEIIIIEYNDGP